MPTDLSHTTVGDIVARDLRTAAIFARHGIDFCCGGHVPLADACRARNVDVALLLEELSRVDTSEDAIDDTSLSIDALIDLIVSEHHAYVRRETPVITALLEKVVMRHGQTHPEVHDVAQAFATLGGELYAHMEKEERVLFPYIAALASGDGTGRPGRPPFGTVRNPISLLQHDHAGAAMLLDHIQRLTNRFTSPPDACTTFKACYTALEAFDRDLREHVHLENNVLFPAALRLEDALSSLT
jgi:regulator of cell morphogenesis and NO signaling